MPRVGAWRGELPLSAPVRARTDQKGPQHAEPAAPASVGGVPPSCGQVTARNLRHKWRESRGKLRHKWRDFYRDPQIARRIALAHFRFAARRGEVLARCMAHHGDSSDAFVCDIVLPFVTKKSKTSEGLWTRWIRGTRLESVVAVAPVPVQIGTS